MRHATGIAPRVTPFLAALAVAAPVLLGAGGASALPPGIYVTTEPMDINTPNFEKALAKAKKAAIVQGDNGKWHLYFVAYLNKPAPEDLLKIVFYEAKAKGKQQPNAFDINTRKGAKILQSEVSVSPEDDIKAGPFILKITMVQGGKEIVFASSKIDLKPAAPAAGAAK